MSKTVLPAQPAASENSGVIETSGPAGVLLEADFLFSADFIQLGDDLLLRGADGKEVLIRGYFSQDPPPLLKTAEGARLSPEMVESLALPDMPLAYAQVGAAQLGQPIGEVSLLNGVARVQRADGTRADLSDGDPIFQGDVVSTGVGSELGILFIDETVFSLSANARMVINELLYNPSSTTNSMGISLIQGTFVFMTGQIAPAGEMEVDTPVGTIGIRGTTVGVQIATLGGRTGIANLAHPDTGEVGSFTFTNAGGEVLFSEGNHFLTIASFSTVPGLPRIASAQETDGIFGRALNRAVEIQQSTTQPQDDDDTDPTDTQEGQIEGETLQSPQEAGLTQEQIDAVLNEPIIETAAGPEGAGSGEGQNSGSGSPGSNGPTSGGSSFAANLTLNEGGPGGPAGTQGGTSGGTTGATGSRNQPTPSTAPAAQSTSNDQGQPPPPPPAPSPPANNAPVAQDDTIFAGEDGNVFSGGAASAAQVEAFLSLTAGTLDSIADDGSDDNGVEVATSGNAIRTQIAVAAGDRISFSFNFLDSEGLGEAAFFQDFAFVVVDGTAFRLSNVGDANTPTDASAAFGSVFINFIEESGYLVFEGTFEISGEVEIGFGVMNEGDEVLDAGLLVDNLVIIRPGAGENQVVFQETFASFANWQVLADDFAAIVGDIGTNEALPGPPNQALLVTSDTSGGFFNVLSDNGNGADSDPDGDGLTVVAVNGNSAAVGQQIVLPSGALLTLSASGGVVYDANGQFEDLPVGESAEDSFTYTISDGKGGSDTATVSVIINGMNDPPVAENDAVSTGEAAVLSGDVLADNGNGADSDPDGDPLAVTAVNGIAANLGQEITLASGAHLTLNANGTFDYDPNGQFDSLAGGESAEDGFTYTLADGNGGSDTATVTVTVNGGTEDNLPPVAQDDSFATNENQNLGGNLLVDNGNGPDSDGNGHPLSVTAVNGLAANVGQQITLTSGAFLSVNSNGNFVYFPNGQFENLAPGQSIEESFTYTVSDGNGGSDTATATITVNGANDPPVAEDDAVATSENAALAGNVLIDNGNGPDSDVDGGPLSVSEVNGSAAAIGQQITLASGALLTLNENGTFDYDPNGQFENLEGGESAEDSFDYTISDGNGGGDTATVAVTVNGVTQDNIPPVAQDDNFTTDEDTPLGGNVRLNNGNGPDSDPDGDPELEPLMVSEVNGSAAAVGQQIELSSGAVLTLNADGTFIYDPNGQFEGLAFDESAEDSFDYTIADGDGGADTATVTITVNGANDPPVAEDDAVATSADVVLAGNVLADNGNGPDGDIDGDPLTVSAVSGSGANLGQEITLASGALLTLNADGTFDYDPNGQFESLAGGESAEDSFGYTIADGNGGSDTATVTVTVNGETEENIPPVAQDDSFATNENQNLGGNLLVDNGNGPDSDGNGHPLSVTAVNGLAANVGQQITLVSGALLSVNGNGNFVYFPNGEFEGLAGGESVEETFTYTISDGNGGTNTATATITVNGANDDPEVTGETVPLVKGTELTITPAILSASDAETGDPALLSFAVSNEIAGQVLLSGGDADSFTLADIQAGLVTFQHDDSVGALAGFTVVASDPDGGASDPVALEFPVASGYVWTNAGGDGDWNNEDNWASGSVPGNGAVVTISDQVGQVNFASGTVALASLTLDGEILNITGGNLDAGNLTWSGGAIVGDGGTLTASGASSIGGTVQILDRELFLSGSSELADVVQGSGSLVNIGDMNVSAAASVGADFVNADGASLFITGGAAAAAAILQLTGGFVQDGEISLASFEADGISGLVVSGGPLDNQGSILSLVGLGGTRSISADLINNGSIVIDAVTVIGGFGGESSNEAGATFIANADVTMGGMASYRNSGSMTVNAAATFTLVGVDFENALGGVIDGGGAIEVIGGSFTNNGTINPGTSPGTLTIDGDFTQGADGVLTIEIDGSGNDILNVTGTADFAGVVNIVLLDGFTPLPGETFDFVTAGEVIDSEVEITGLTFAGGFFGIQLEGGTATIVATAGDGDTFVDPNEIIVGEESIGSLTVDAGQSLHSQYFSVGEEAGSIGTFVLTNASQLTIEGESHIGKAGSGDATISGGAQATFIDDTFENLNIGRLPGSSGSLLVDGVGTVVTTVGIDNTVQVGREGTGEMTVQDGAKLSTLQLEAGRNGDGTIVIQGAGTEVSVSNDHGRGGDDFDPYAGAVYAGHFNGGFGRISVLDQAVLEIRNGEGVNEDTLVPELILGFDGGSQGEIQVSGDGSRIVLSQAAPALQNGSLYGPYVAVGQGGLGSLTIEGGGLVELTGGSPSIFVGDRVGAEGSVLVDGDNSLLSLSGESIWVAIGYEGTGSLSISNNASFEVSGADGFLELGVNAGGSGSLSVSSGANASVEGGTIIGLEGQGDATIGGGAQATFESENFDNLVIAEGAGSVGNVLIDGPGTTVTTVGTDNTVQVGWGGTGSLTVQNGAALNTLQLEAGRSGSGTITIQGADTEVTVSNDNGRFSEDYDFGAGFVRVGRIADSQGTLEVREGAHLQIRNGIGENEDTREPGLQIAAEEGSLGTVLIDGDGSSLDITQTSPVDPTNEIYGPFLQVGRGGDGSLTVQNGGTLSLSAGHASLAVGRIATGSGNLLIDGAGSSVTMTGAQLNAYIGHEGYGETTLSNGGFLSLQGDGSDFTQLIVGQENGSTGQLSIISGSQTSVQGGDGNTRLRVGREEGSDGSVVVSGAGSLLDVGGTNDSGSFNNRIEIGSSGNGSLQTLSGATVVAERLDIGFDSTGVGTAVVDDATWQISGHLWVGREGEGTLTIRNGGIVHVGDAFSSIAMAGGTTGLVVIEANSQLICDGFLSIANGSFDPGSPDFGQDAAAFGTLNILGGTVSAVDSNIGGEVRGNGTVLIDGAGALFDVANVLTIGSEGTGKLTVGNGGTLEAGAAQGDDIIDIIINAGGTLEILAGGTVVGDIFNNGGILINGNSPGIATFGGDFAMENGIVEVELEGSGASNFDLYQVLGTAVLEGGLLEFKVLDDYIPLTGDAFTFFTAAGGLILGADLSYAFYGVAEGFDFEVAYSEEAAGLTIVNSAGAGSSVVFRGGAGEDSFAGGVGNDHLDGGGGSDTLTGGAGSDLFILRSGDAVDGLELADVITDFEVGIDGLGLADGLTAGDLAIGSTENGDAVIGLQSSGAFLAVLQGVSAAEISLDGVTTEI